MTDSNADEQYMLTTVDNPYSPFTQYEEWFALDAALGYHTPGLLARYVYSSDDLSDVDQLDAINQGIDEVVQENPFGIYRKVSADAYAS